MFTRRRAVGALVAALASPALAGAQSPSQIRIGLANADPYMDPYFAQDLGNFRKAGLDVMLEPFANGGALMSAVVGSSLDVGSGDIITLANAVNHGLSLAYFAGGATYTKAHPTQVLCVPKNSSIQTAKDLEGQIIGCVNQRSLAGLSIYEWVRKNGGDNTKIKLYEMGFAEMPAALARGTIPCALVGEPFLSAVKDDARRLGDTFTAIADAFYINNWYATRDWLTRDAETAIKVRGALYDTARYVNAHRDQPAIAAIEAKYTNIDPQRLQAMDHNLFATSLEQRLMQPVIDLALRYNYIDKPVTFADLTVNLNG